MLIIAFRLKCCQICTQPLYMYSKVIERLFSSLEGKVSNPDNYIIFFCAVFICVHFCNAFGSFVAILLDDDPGRIMIWLL